MAAAPRQRPQEAQAKTGVTGEDLPGISYEQYYKCGWPSVVQTAAVEYKIEILTRGLENNWARGGSGGAYGDSNDLALMQGPADATDDEEPANLLESLSTFVPTQAQSILGVEECHVEADATQRVFDGTSGGLRRLRHRELQGQQPSTAGIVQIIARGSRYDDDAGECTSSLQGNGYGAEDGVICTPLKSFSTVVYDPKVTDEQAASQVAMAAISEAVTTIMSPSPTTTDESRLQGAVDTSIFANNVVGIQVTGWSEIAVESDVVVPIPSDNSDIAVDVDDNVASPGTQSGKDSLSSGAKAGITISLLLLALAVVAMLVVRKRRRRSEVNDPKSDSDMGDNTTYNEKTYDLSLYEHPTGTGLSTFKENEMIGDGNVEDTAHATLEQNDTTCCLNVGSNGRSMSNVNAGATNGANLY